MSEDTFSLNKEALIDKANAEMETTLLPSEYTLRQKLALTCRILFENGHDSGLAGQITTRTDVHGTYLSQRLGLGSDEISEDNLLVVH